MAACRYGGIVVFEFEVSCLLFGCIPINPCTTLSVYSVT